VITINPEAIAFGERLRTARLAKGWRHTDIAERMACHAPDLVPWEKGRRFPGFATLVRLARALGVSLDWLMLGHDKVPNFTPRVEVQTVKVDAPRVRIVHKPCPRCRGQHPLGIPTEWRV